MYHATCRNDFWIRWKTDSPSKINVSLSHILLFQSRFSMLDHSLIFFLWQRKFTIHRAFATFLLRRRSDSEWRKGLHNLLFSSNSCIWRFDCQLEAEVEYQNTNQGARIHNHKLRSTNSRWFFQVKRYQWTLTLLMDLHVTDNTMKSRWERQRRRRRLQWWWWWGLCPCRCPCRCKWMRRCI